MAKYDVYSYVLEFSPSSIRETLNRHDELALGRAFLYWLSGKDELAHRENTKSATELGILVKNQMKANISGLDGSNSFSAIRGYSDF